MKLPRARLGESGLDLLPSGALFPLVVWALLFFLGAGLALLGCKERRSSSPAGATAKSLQEGASEAAWPAPPCPLIYRLRAEVVTHDVEEDGSVGPVSGSTSLTGRFRLSADEEGALLVEGRELVSRQAQRSVESPPEVLTDVEPVRLARRGPGLTEVGGPTRLWSAGGAFPGLVLLFPDRPEDKDTGWAPWPVEVHARGASEPRVARRLEAEVKSAKGAPAPDGGGAAARQLLARWMSTTSTGGALPLVQRATGSGRYRLTSGGHLAAAEVEERTQVKGVVGEEVRREHRVLTARADLVESCPEGAAP